MKLTSTLNAAGLTTGQAASARVAGATTSCRGLLRPALTLLVLLSALTGLAYPALVTGLAQTLFPFQANGSLVRDGERVVGSVLIGQSFTAAHYFHGRPSATADRPYNAMASGGSNLGPANPELVRQVRERIAALAPEPAGQTVPLDLVTSSASGLDPDISPAAAFYQVARVARARGLPEEAVAQLVRDLIQPPQWGMFGEPRVNVLQLNRQLDQLASR
ncbi:potassium-transporting ATPase subunit KdpC [Laribacter hongkongensis]|uniref:potassium-transporting ATPase subunit KdpC n=1 Tax=Laribacter hongkongensis TaxID=168471 RepID=UPI001EFD0201|nr:potassium-transporting ATPase subunit KdpC [Laribacter hongkongensis]MCG8991882.1 potassium-transporting ATPase subunit KdpC [Laribacter hongkongensis]MCG8997387.1 potassium-transporting ATPase subunit KdpC [Laribacter hongkongensis]MCG9000751.1 potassium-transporting ATPase subunit KdpC [Laribacter hongkongensis]MCG9004320.1 potassium-transporting ATPase subunit KdpC [Laribacter hongkongensis]MCG9007107.1 potassium-transporting ATPase subunit KdpC [Laribacter hongkongensis]